jgi:UDP-N-acetylglucosamine--N-acetylmuramyl-(pentapeptide) pyrophosphoryl-undecaprenol N-acetylglucosamine transferase
LVYLGSSYGMERSLVPPTGVTSYFLPMAPPFTPRGVVLTAPAILRSIAVIRRTRPRVVFATGGYVSTAAVVAAWLTRTPIVLFSPDVYAGKAVRALAPLANRIALTVPEAASTFPARKSVVTGYPLRHWFASASRVRGRERLGVKPDETLLVVFGGSLGARHINQATAAALPQLLTHSHVLHIAGEQRLSEAAAASMAIPPEVRARYHLVPYLHDQDMADALAASDLAICRSGASILAELPAVGTPAVLVPLPDQAVHQRENAEYLVSHGAAILLDDGDLDSFLQPTVSALLADPARLAAMRTASAALARPRATETLARLIEEFAA